MNIFAAPRHAAFAQAAFAAAGLDFEVAFAAGDVNCLKRGSNAPRLAVGDASGGNPRHSTAESLSGLEATKAALKSRRSASSVHTASDNGFSAFRGTGGQELTGLAATESALKARRQN